MRLHKKAKKINYMFAAITMSDGSSASPHVEITTIIPDLIQLHFPPTPYILMFCCVTDIMCRSYSLIYFFGLGRELTWGWRRLRRLFRCEPGNWLSSWADGKEINTAHPVRQWTLIRFANNVVCTRRRLMLEDTPVSCSISTPLYHH